MKVTILSGSDLEALHKRKKQIVKAISERGWETQLVNNQTSLAEQFRVASLFESQKLYIVDDHKILSDKNAAWLKNNLDFDANLLVVIENALPAKIKNIFGKRANVEVFDLPRKVFIFLESIYPGNGKNCVFLLHEVIQKDPVELVFALTASHLRDLYWVKTDPTSLSLPSWRKDKLKRQAQRFTELELKQLIKDFARIDMEAKTSKSTLSQSLDLLLVTSLK